MGGKCLLGVLGGLSVAWLYANDLNGQQGGVEEEEEHQDPLYSCAGCALHNSGVFSLGCGLLGTEARWAGFCIPSVWPRHAGRWLALQRISDKF